VQKIKLGVVQMTSAFSPEENWPKIEAFFAEAKSLDVQYLFFPECFYSLGDGTKISPHQLSFTHPDFLRLQELCSRYGIAFCGGSAPFHHSDKDQRPWNRALFIDNLGKLQGYYDKIHLFKASLPQSDGSRKEIREDFFYSAGNLPSVINSGKVKFGLGICFDMRFPDLFQFYQKSGVQILSVASAFTVPTGKAHWHTLLRARAIETQSFVVASAQWGQNNTRVATYGHSLVVNPWGEVLLDLEEGEKLGVVECDLSMIHEVKNKVIL
jgi:deaminated glutathione amidase